MQKRGIASTIRGANGPLSSAEGSKGVCAFIRVVGMPTERFTLSQPIGKAVYSISD